MFHPRTTASTPFDLPNDVLQHRVGRISFVGHSNFEKHRLKVHELAGLNRTCVEDAGLRDANARPHDRTLEWGNCIRSFAEVHGERLKAEKICGTDASFQPCSDSTEKYVRVPMRLEDHPNVECSDFSCPHRGLVCKVAANGCVRAALSFSEKLRKNFFKMQSPGISDTLPAGCLMGILGNSREEKLQTKREFSELDVGQFDEDTNSAVRAPESPGPGILEEV
jgi:hypothetical protein